jgi:hypothetical protein
MKQFIQLGCYAEQGSEGTDWIGRNLLDVKYTWEWKWLMIRRVKNYYETMIDLEDNDKLAIFKDNSATEILWQGVIKKDTTSNSSYYYWISKLLTDFHRYGDIQPLRDRLARHGFETLEMEFGELLEICKVYFSQQTSNRKRCHWLQEGVDPDEWGRYFLDERCAYLERDE